MGLVAEDTAAVAWGHGWDAGLSRETLRPGNIPLCHGCHSGVSRSQALGVRCGPEITGWVWGPFGTIQLIPGAPHMVPGPGVAPGMLQQEFPKHWEGLDWGF